MKFYASAWTWPLQAPEWGVVTYALEVLLDKAEFGDDEYSIWATPGGFEVVSGISKEESFTHARKLVRLLNPLIANAESEHDLVAAVREYLVQYAHDEFAVPLPLHPRLKSVPSGNHAPPPISYGVAPPSHPFEGAIWHDPQTGKNRVFNQGKWVLLP